MVRTNSNYVELGTLLPDAQLLEVNSGKNFNINGNSLDRRHLLIMFICAHCPFVKHIENQITKLTKDTKEIVQTLAISSNDVQTHPADSPEYLKKQAELNDWSFPYLYDRDQQFAKMLKAACTPDFYLFTNQGNSKFSLFYHGQLDDSRPSNGIDVTGSDLRNAIKTQQKEKIYKAVQKPSLGCNIKWIEGHEPKWFN